MKKCFNCGARVEELHRVPDFDYMGCDACYDEAIAVLAAEATECDCRYIDIDQVDASGCELHGRRAA